MYTKYLQMFFSSAYLFRDALWCVMCFIIKYELHYITLHCIALYCNALHCLNISIAWIVPKEVGGQKLFGWGAWKRGAQEKEIIWLGCLEEGSSGEGHMKKLEVRNYLAGVFGRGELRRGSYEEVGGQKLFGWGVWKRGAQERVIYMKKLEVRNYLAGVFGRGELRRGSYEEVGGQKLFGWGVWKRGAQERVIWRSWKSEIIWLECLEEGRSGEGHMRNLHWLQVRQRKIFKIATLMFWCLNGLAPSYLAAGCIVVSAIPFWRQLRSATSGQLYIPRTRTVTYGPRSFKVCSPTIWNDLPARMKDPSLSVDSFRKLLKTFLFDKWLLHERICGSCINLCGEMFIVIIIIIIIMKKLEVRNYLAGVPGRGVARERVIWRSWRLEIIWLGCLARIDIQNYYQYFGSRWGFSGGDLVVILLIISWQLISSRIISWCPLSHAQYSFIFHYTDHRFPHNTQNFHFITNTVQYFGMYKIDNKWNILHSLFSVGVVYGSVINLLFSRN